jgi:hypothetical protein
MPRRGVGAPPEATMMERSKWQPSQLDAFIDRLLLPIAGFLLIYGTVAFLLEVWGE